MVDNRDEQGIFISYRRSGARADAGRLYDRLTQQFGNHRVFMDIDDIKPGQRFQDVLRATLAECKVLLVLIGPGWLQVSDEQGKLRLQDEDDFVRMEISTALQRRLPIIPILFNRARMPRRNELPDAIAPLADHQALEISDNRFHEDVNNLISALQGILSGGDLRWYRRGHVVAVSAAMAVVVAGLLFWAGKGYWPTTSEVGGTGEQAPGTEIQVEQRLELRAEATTLSSADFNRMLIRRGLFDKARNPDGEGMEHRFELEVQDLDRVVIDHATSLMWQQSGTGSSAPIGSTTMTLDSLNRRSFAGFADWRLPTIEELMSLLTPVKQPSAHMSPLLSPKDTPILWSADRTADGNFWLVYAYSGTGAVESDNFNAWLRAVRTIR